MPARALSGGPSLARLARALRELIFPPACLGCGGPLEEGEPFLCPACAARVEPMGETPCRRCGRRLETRLAAGGECPACRRWPPPYDLARAVARHDGPLAEALRRFKYGGSYVLGPGLAGLLAAGAPSEILAWAEMAAPVPLHPRRLLRRGFNQSLILALGLARRPGLKIVPRLLSRLRHTRPQVGLGPRERAANVAGAFAVNPDLAHLARGRRVLIVDDVFTTGATVSECARALLAAGAAGAAVLTLTRGGDPTAGLPKRVG